MKATYDATMDIVRIVFVDAPVEESEEIHPGVIIDYDASGSIIGMEILDASMWVQEPASMDFFVRQTHTGVVPQDTAA